MSYKTIVFIKLDVSFFVTQSFLLSLSFQKRYLMTIPFLNDRYNDNPLLTIFNDDPLLTIVNNEPLLTIINDYFGLNNRVRSLT